jgi:hypothetical protein
VKRLIPIAAFCMALAGPAAAQELIPSDCPLNYRCTPIADEMPFADSVRANALEAQENNHEARAALMAEGLEPGTGVIAAMAYSASR